ncbi:HNH endonuclease signature motif containing protein [Bdellovibrio sp. 22V]|uniref:HNH endonuclease n=1 Tax=Bdellovibrio sp. 22V TaxID=3044166 RepID=UPI002543E8D9|nr:HNH endonuclease signature motif containing protein [Bdellovibrio sp. 22V]WII71686.1 HNH endonuclease signature motif containing protein [Bdellovibrio sp. 22V]
MDLSKISNVELLNRLEKLARTERKITHLILWHINEVESRRLFAELGFDSMFKYLTKHLGYGEDSAYRRLQAARLLKQVPAVAEKLEEGSLNLTQLTQVQKCIKQEIKIGNRVETAKTEQILEDIQNKSSFETLKYLAQEFDQPIQAHEIRKPQQDNSVRLEITFSEDQMEILEEAKSLLSHVLPGRTWADLFTHLAKKHIQKELGKSNPNQKSPKMPDQTALPRNPASSTKRAHIKLTLKRELLRNAGYCCEYINPKTKKKCDSVYQLQIDHRLPLAKGGSDKKENLRVLCRTHNLLAAKQWGLSSR